MRVTISKLFEGYMRDTPVIGNTHAIDSRATLRFFWVYQGVCCFLQKATWRFGSLGLVLASVFDLDAFIECEVW